MYQGQQEPGTLTVLEKGLTEMEKEKTRMNPVVLDWNWEYQCEFMVFNTEINTHTHTP